MQSQQWLVGHLASPSAIKCNVKFLNHAYRDTCNKANESMKFILTDVAYKSFKVSHHTFLVECQLGSYIIDRTLTGETIWVA